MTHDTFDDELLMAYADGELAPAERARVAAAVDHDPALQARIDAFARSRRLVREAGMRAAAAPVPPALEAAVRRAAADRGPGAEPTTVVTLRRPGAGAPAAGWRSSAIAASVALLVGAAGGWLVGSGPGELATLLGPVDPALSDILASEPAGASAAAGSAEISVLGSFRTAEGSLCREYRIDGAAAASYAAIACHDGRTWRSELVVRVEGDGAGFVPASGQATLDAHAAELGAGPFLDPAAEREALAGLR